MIFAGSVINQPCAALPIPQLVKTHKSFYSVSRVDSSIIRRSFSFSPSRVLNLILTNIPNATKNSILSCNINWIGVPIVRFNIVPRSANTKTIAAHVFIIIVPLSVLDLLPNPKPELCSILLQAHQQ